MMAVVLVAVSAALCGAGETAPLNVVTAYQFPVGTCRTALRNTSPDKVSLESLEVVNLSGESVGTAWIAAEPRTVPPGGMAAVTFRLEAMLNPGCTVLLRGDFGELHLPLDPHPRLVVTYAVHVREEETVYLYVLSQSDTSCVITGASVSDAPVSLKGSVAIGRGEKALVSGVLAVAPSAAYEVPLVTVALTVADGPPVVVLTRLFRPEHTVFQPVKGNVDTAECLTHTFADGRTAAAKAIEAAEQNAGKLRTIKFCNLDLAADGPSHFAQIMERNHIEPQLTYPHEAYSEGYVKMLLRSVGEAKTASEPGISYCYVLPSDIHDASKPPFPLVRLRTMMYAMLAAGSKGLELHPPKFNDPGEAYAKASSRLLEVLMLLQELVGVSEPVDLCESVSLQDVPVRTLLCGDKGVLLFVFAKDGGSGGPETARLTLREPYPLARYGWSVQGEDDVTLTSIGDLRSELQVPLLEGAQLYYIEPAQATAPDAAQPGGRE